MGLLLLVMTGIIPSFPAFRTSKKLVKTQGFNVIQPIKMGELRQDEAQRRELGRHVGDPTDG